MELARVVVAVFIVLLAPPAGAQTCTPPNPGCTLDPPCPNGVPLGPIVAGSPDDFCAPTEPASPGALLGSSLFCTNTVLKNFDDLAANQKICHTMTGIPAGIGAAILEIRLRPSANTGAFNDSVSLQLTASGTNFLWSRRIGSDGAITGLLGVPWTDTSPAFSRCLNLAALPNEDGSTTNIIPDLVATGRLDIHVQDDSAVDYARLWLAQCACEPLPNGSGCWQAACPHPNDHCRPELIVSIPGTIETGVTKCDCVNADQCYLVPGPAGVPHCEGLVCPVNRWSRWAIP